MLKVNLLRILSFILSLTGVIVALLSRGETIEALSGVFLAFAGYLLDLDSRISYYDLIFKQAKEKHEKENKIDEQSGQ